MGYLKIHNDKVTSVNADLIANICPFGAIEKTDNGLQINAACKMCRLCVKKSGGIVEYVEQTANSVDKTQYNGIAVFGEIVSNVLHPVTYELLAKARQLSIDSKTNQPVYLLLLGRNVEVPDDLLQAGADRIFVYDNSVFKDFLIDVYTDAFVDFVNRVKPSSVLVASTNLGRVLAPKVAAHFRTGLTADCTMLQMKPNSDLVQIRPAFGGNIMAQIVTPNNRPQFATVRYKIFDRLDKPYSTAEVVQVDYLPKQSRITCLNSQQIVGNNNLLSEADVIVAVGRGVDQQDLQTIANFARAIKGQVGCTRPMVESGLFDARRQIGLSGRTVKPKLIITLGVSGAIQFVAGMQTSKQIIAVNSDANAPIFAVAHVGIVADYKSALAALADRIDKVGEQL